MRISPSAMKAFEECPRLWWVTYVAGLRKPHTSATWRGETVHKMVEGWLLTGELTPPTVEQQAESRAKDLIGRAWSFQYATPEIIAPVAKQILEQGEVEPVKQDWIRMAEKLCQALWDRGVRPKVPPGQVEAEASIDFPGWPGIVGRVDFWSPPPLPLDPSNGELLVVDHKTTGNLAFAVKQSEITRNFQAIVYSYSRTHNTKWNGNVRFVFNYASSAKDVHVVEHLWTADELKGAMATVVLPTVMSMCQAAQIADVRETKPNPASCGNYGGCPNLADCVLLGVIPGM